MKRQIFDYKRKVQKNPPLFVKRATSLTKKEKKVLVGLILIWATISLVAFMFFESQNLNKEEESCNKTEEVVDVSR